MFTFILIGSQSRQIDIHTLVEQLGSTQNEKGDRYVVYDPAGMENGWIAVQPLCDAEKDFDSSELNRVREFLKDPCFILVEGRDGEIRYSDRFVLALDYPETFVIDNDHGLIERADKIQKMIRAGKSWINASL